MFLFVIDSDGLLENFEGMVEVFCDSVGIFFIFEVLMWEVGGDLLEYSWWDGGLFYYNFVKLMGLMFQVWKYVEVVDVFECVQFVYWWMKLYYD